MPLRTRTAALYLGAVKYPRLVLRADIRGNGGILALARTPPLLVANLRYNRVPHENVLVACVITDDVRRAEL